MSVESLINRYGKSVQHGTKNVAVDAVGGSVETWSYALGEIALVQIDGGSDAVVGGRENESRTAVFFFRSGKSIQIDDRIKHAGGDYEVRSVRIPHERTTTDRLSYVIVRAEKVLS